MSSTRNFRILTGVLCAFSSIVLACGMAYGQALSGTLVGTVVDSTGAAVANAQIEVTNVGTNVANRTKTNGSGQYRLDNLAPGSYKVTAKARPASRPLIKR